jgi:AcrR family transcriptional regulator
VTGSHDVRQRLLDSTVELLRERGPRATSPAAVAYVAGASKMSLYRHFEGIEELVAAALGEYDEPHRAYLLGPTDHTPRRRLEAMFQRAADRADDPAYRGCLYVSTALAVSDLDGPTVEVSAGHKRAMIEGIARLLSEAGDPTPDETAGMVQILMDGALVHAVLRGSGEPLRQAGRALVRIAPSVFGP